MPIGSHVPPPRVSSAQGGLCAPLPPRGWKCHQWGGPGLVPAFQCPGAGRTQPHVLTDLNSSHPSPLTHSKEEGVGTKREPELPAAGSLGRQAFGWSVLGRLRVSPPGPREGGEGGEAGGCPWALSPAPLMALGLLCHPSSGQFPASPRLPGWPRPPAAVAGLGASTTPTDLATPSPMCGPPRCPLHPPGDPSPT